MHGKSGKASKAIFNFPEEPLILKFLILSTNSLGRDFSSVMFRKVRFASKLETIFLA